MAEYTEVKINQIRTDGGTQPRAQLNWTTVSEYAESIEDGAALPPVEVVYDGKDYWLWDGFHRVEAHKKAGCTAIRANVKQGTRRDAVLASVGANSSHGLRRTNDDKRRAVMTLLNDAEWVKWSDREIARRCAVHHDMVGKLRPSLAETASEDNSRTYTTKHGTTATMNTTNIGKTVTPPVGTIKLTPPLAAPISTPKPANTFVSPLPEPEVVRTEVRYVPAPPIRDDEEFDDMADEAKEDADGYDWTEEDDCGEFDTVTIIDVSGSEETLTIPGGISGITEALEITHEIKSNGMAVHFSSESPEHYTPKEIIDAAIEVMGAIDLDPCSNSKDAPNVPALDHYTAADDGLSMPWFGRVYMNPPYGRVIGGWTEKLAAEYEAGNVTEAIALVPGRIDTQWWQALGENYHACFVTGRLTFIGNDDPAPFPSTVFYFGENVAKFFEVFSAIGQIWKRIDEHWFTD